MVLRWRAPERCQASCSPSTLTRILIIPVVLLPVLLYVAEKYVCNSTSSSNDSAITCMDGCRISLVESISVGLNYSNDSVVHKTTHRSWMELIGAAKNTIEIASLSWILKRRDDYPDDTAKQGREVFQALLEAGRDRGVQLRIVHNIHSQQFPSLDSEDLAKEANAQIQSLNLTRLLGGGVAHAKFWIIDRTHVYVGSANTDWKSLTHLKELGFVAFNCSCLANDLAKIFETYWKLDQNDGVPPTWPASLGTKINMDNPLSFTIDGNEYRSYIASSPPQFSPEGRTDDLDAILRCIDEAKNFIHISVTRYLPLKIFSPKIKYWPVIDNALRSAAVERRINVKLLVTLSEESQPSMDYFLRSLVDLTNSYRGVKIEVKRFIVPMMPNVGKIPFWRYSHSKYMVTDNTAYIGSSNWSDDYIVQSSGVSTVFEVVGNENQDSIRQQLENVFHRDWNSPYAHPQNTSNSDMGISKNALQ